MTASDQSLSSARSKNAAMQTCFGDTLAFHAFIQGWTKRLQPGLVNLRMKNYIPLAAVGRKTQFFSSNSPNLAEAF